MIGLGGSCWWVVPAAGVSAAVAAACAVFAVMEHRDHVARRRFDASGVGDRDGGTRHGACEKGRLDDRLIALAEFMSRKMQSNASALPLWSSARISRWCAEHLRRAGIAEGVSAVGFCAARVRVASAAMLCGLLVGLVFSAELSILLALAGAAMGWVSLSWAVRQREKRRVDELERHLSEMLEVVALGLRSGLSFDRSLQLYVEHFDTLLSLSCASAQRQWSLGLTTRDEALRALAATFDSPMFSRVVENVIRSLRFGSSLAEILESAAAEARLQFRSRKQEQVAKASVKMLVPTGALMLPAMLLLVMGPVLLELMEGF